MSLIEVILDYAYIVCHSGRSKGQDFLNDVVDKPLHIHIINTVNDNGMLVTADHILISHQDVENAINA